MLMVQMGVAQSRASTPYPNELPGYRFYRSAKWRTLVPLVATIEKVRLMLGPPVEATDLAAYFKPYPSDSEAKQPLLTYRLNRDWQTLLYFGPSCSSLPKPSQGIGKGRLCSIEIVPSRRRSFRSVSFPAVYRKEHVNGVDAGWDEYSDGSGLVYEVYTTRTPYGDEVPGDLNRIVYGPSTEQVERLLKSKK